jgi:hypothetical protein
VGANECVRVHHVSGLQLCKTDDIWLVVEYPFSDATEIEETTVSPAIAAMARSAVSSAWELKQMLGNMSKLTTNATSILNCIRGTPTPDWYGRATMLEFFTCMHFP